MTLTVRERFIYHFTVVKLLLSSGLFDEKFLKSIVNSALESRCRGLTKEQVQQLFLDMEEELRICMDSKEYGWGK